MNDEVGYSFPAEVRATVEAFSLSLITVGDGQKIRIHLYFTPISSACREPDRTVVWQLDEAIRLERARVMHDSPTR